LSRTDVPTPPVIPKPAANMRPTFQPFPVPLQVAFANVAEALATTAGWAGNVFPELLSWAKTKGG
jgi:hypothetical protein